ncbi:MAG: hypothetical protein AAF193_11155 [Bacteroidota bacterium]
MEATLKRYWNEYVKPYFKDEARSNKEIDWIYYQHSRPNRFYHGLGHLEFLLTAFEDIKAKLKSPHLVVIAIFYHDSVFNALKKNNEEKSAKKAIDALKEGALSPPEIEKVHDLIMATKSHIKSEDQDINLFVDMDLAILGSSYSEYEKYSASVRKEYSVFPDFIYNKGRKDVLKHFPRL